MADISSYSIEYRVLAATWYFECDRSIAAVRLLKAKLRERYGIEPPDTRVITAWTDKFIPLAQFWIEKEMEDQMNEEMFPRI